MPYARAYYEAYQDWASWLSSGLIDFVTIMDYSINIKQFEGWISVVEEKTKDLSKIKIAVGAYKMVNTLDSMIGYRNARYQAFGWASARCDDLLNLIPARLAGLIMSVACAFVPRGQPLTALGTMWRDARKHRSPNSGWTEAAMAGGLGLSLNGPRRYGTIIAQDPWLGDGRARATPADMRKALMVFVMACLLQILIIGGLVQTQTRTRPATAP